MLVKSVTFTHFAKEKSENEIFFTVLEFSWIDTADTVCGKKMAGPLENVRKSYKSFQFGKTIYSIK